ncbi:cycloisomerase 2 family [Sugiyamaella lignohabitans]|uniref:Cycloisomerase 2 family n=1 Tax=Sugiyamaella lignohabitans TaxID=796027 RepID=A0A167FM58_9ASCO|nr:cycloisomerase 2 family [Sugiyamaella lignohabitans]ANB15471.1 cycloisomerase 2 family [Sugiyamaella lignohabitans]
MKLIIGTFGNDVYLADFDRTSGILTHAGKSSFGSAATWILDSHQKGLLYATDETTIYSGSGAYETSVGAVIAFKVDFSNEKLPLTKTQSVLSKGKDPTHLFVTSGSENNLLFVANYNGGTVASYNIDATGLISAESSSVIDLSKDSSFQVGPRKDRQEWSHPHWIGQPPLCKNNIIYLTDLGQDKIFQYEISNGILKPLEVPFLSAAKGAGPRHIAFHTTQPLAYVLNELDSTLSVYEYDVHTGQLKTEIQKEPTVSSNILHKTNPSAIRVDRENRFVYITNRDISSDKSGNDSITVFKIITTGVTHVQNISSGGYFPRHGDLSPDEKWYIVGNQGNDRVDVFSRQYDTGLLEWRSTLKGIEKPAYIYFHQE